LDRTFGATIPSYNTNDLNLIQAIYRGEITQQIEVEYGSGDISDMSAYSYQLYSAFTGDFFINLKTGFTKLIQYFMSQVGTYVRPNCEVRNIDWSDSNKIQVSLMNGSSYTADYVISAIPLGYLKDNVNTLFTPTLSYQKRFSIKKLAFGTIDKLFLVFPSKIFNNGEKAMTIYWTKDNPILNSKYNLNVNLFFLKT
jgi:protoporphyrinogen oxidase